MILKLAATKFPFSTIRSGQKTYADIPGLQIDIFRFCLISADFSPHRLPSENRMPVESTRLTPRRFFHVGSDDGAKPVHFVWVVSESDTAGHPAIYLRQQSPRRLLRSTERRNSMVEMTHADSIPGLGTDFDAFLFAPIGEESNGIPLSVVSALARLDVDPWQEAARLSRLPAESATRRLTSLLEALPEAAPPRRNPGTVAARLIGLLPHLAAPQGSTIPPLGTGTTNKPSTMLIWTIVMMLILSAQWIAAGHQQPPAPGTDTSAPISSRVTPDVPRP